ncbi:MAG: phosphotransferase [Janthinobacterium lividum]
MVHQHPTTAEGITAPYLTGLMQEITPGARVDAVTVVDAKLYGQQMVSTAARAILDVEYAPGSPADLPTRLVLKLARGFDKIMAPFYSNEVAFYRRIRPELDLEVPRCFGGDYDPGTGRFGLLLEDLTLRDAQFPNVTQPITPETVRSLLDLLASLHARYWESPRFEGDLGWVEAHVGGRVADMLNGEAPAYIQHEIDNENFKREMVQRLRTTGPELLAGVKAMQRHQATVPRTLLHGDTHLGNTYLLPGNQGGLLDWQLMVRGHHMHDVNYLITTSLSIGDRREHERELLAYYLDRLGQEGVAVPPTFDTAWHEYRLTLVWGVYIGWLTTPVVNYGWEINVLNHLRLTTAYEDHETGRLVSALL